MAPTPSPRDHDADANPDVSRKRARLSEEGDSPASDTAVVIEALAPELIGCDPVNAIEIEDDESMALYSDTFNIFPDNVADSVGQVRHMRKRIASDYFLQPAWFLGVVIWLSVHLRDTEDEPSDALHQAYTDDDDFFGEFAMMALSLLQRDDMFEETDLFRYPDIASRLPQFILDLTKLSTRFLVLLPAITKEQLQRRDSAQLAARSGEQQITSLHYVRLAEQLLSLNVKNALYLRNGLRLDLKNAREACRKLLLENEDTPRCLVEILYDLTQHLREVKDAWVYVDTLLSLGKCSVYVGDNAEAVLEIVNLAILPAVREKHPRALVDQFHEHLVNSCGEILRQQSWQSFGAAWATYQNVVKGDEDALLPEGEDGLQKLRRVCDGNLNMIPPLLKAAWVLQALRSFIVSSIMDVRSCGINLLSRQLCKWFAQFCQNTDEGVDHPVIQYTARFLRRNELTGYIFSANSHASIINHSEDIISFLAATQNYTDQETDIIWHACTTSVEADFVKASFAVLQHVSRRLGFDHLKHIIHKYTTTPIGSISNQAAVDALPAFFTLLHMTMTSACVQQESLAAAMLGLDLLEHLQTQERIVATDQLLAVAMTEISTAIRLDMEQHLQIYQRCVPHILDRTELATSAMQVMALFLKAGLSQVEAAHLLAMLPAKAVMDELCYHITRIAQVGTSDIDSHGASLICRVDVVVYLLSLTTGPYDSTDVDLVFQYLFGELALDNTTRNIAWAELTLLSRDTTPRPAAIYLLDHYLGQLVPSISTKYATPALVGLLTEPLKHRILADSLQAEYPRILGWPMWKTLVRIAVESPDAVTAQAALAAMGNLLFSWPHTFSDKTAIVQCHAQFVREFVHQLCQQHADLSRFNVDLEIRIFCQAMSVLSIILQKSKEVQASFQIPKPPDTIVLGNASNDVDSFCFSVQLYSPDAHQRVISVLASQSTTVAELNSALPGHTGTLDNRVIIGGRPLNLKAEAASTLSKAGVRASGVIMISPVYTPDCDLDKVLTDPGPTEQEVLAQHDRLEVFLDGPSMVAQSAFLLLATVRPSSSARFRIEKADITAAELFPQERPWRTVYSLHLFGSLLETHARFAMADRGFIARGVRFLTDLVMADGPTFDPGLLLQAIGRLHQFLLEKPEGDATAQYLDNPAEFATRTIDIISRAMQLPVDSTLSMPNLAIRADLVLMTYRTVLQACRVEERVWQSFTGDDRSAALHAQILLDEDSSLPACVAECIKNLCIDPSEPAVRVERYWSMAMAIIGQALDRPFAATAYFNLTAELLNYNRDVQNDETKARDLVQGLLAQLQSYTHQESPGFAMVDSAMEGLLRLVSAALTVLKSFKKPLDLGRLSVDLFERLLFAPPIAGARPLLSDESRNIAFDIVKATCESVEDYKDLAHASCRAMQELPADAAQKFPGVEGWIRPATTCAGLTNLGMTCYMNSLLQQLFANLSFRKFIFDTPIVDAGKQVFLTCVQDLFARMQDGGLCAADTTNLASVLAIQIQNQEDVHGFYATFLGRLEDSMLDDERKKVLKTFYTGMCVSQVKASCGHVSTKTEPITDLPITVKNKASLSDSLNEFVQGEPMQGANMYRCHTCDPDNGRLVDAMKRTCLEEVPNNLTFCLKRFTFETMMGMEGKVNDRFEFPQEIDMAVYQRRHLEQPDEAVPPDVFELVGVIVHQGTLEFGHYWSYVRLAGSATWIRLEDQHVQTCDNVQEVQQQCFGGLVYNNGQEKTDSGYVLFYQRRSHIEEQAQLVKPLCGTTAMSKFLPPRVQVPSELAQSISIDRSWRHKVANLFAPHYADFMSWLIATYPGPEPKQSDDDSMSDSSSTASNGLEGTTGPAVASATYLLRIVLPDVPNDKKLKMCTHAITSALRTHGRAFAKEMLRVMMDESDFFVAIWRHSVPEYRATVSTLVEHLLGRLREGGEECHMDFFRQVLNIHSSLLREVGAIYSAWPEYFSFAANLTKPGPVETAAVLDYRYMDTIYDIMYIRWLTDDIKRKYPQLWNLTKNDRIDLTALFSFLHDVLSEHVDLSSTTNLSPRAEPHQIFEGLVYLREAEWGVLIAETPIEHVNQWLMALIGCKQCPVTTDWNNFAPGKLVSLLVGPKAALDLMRVIERTLIIRFDQEQFTLQQMLYMTLHFCASKCDADCKEVLRQLGKNLSLWESSHPVILKFLDVAVTMAPCSTIDSASEWAFELLTVTSAKARTGMKLWLEENLFTNAQPDDPPTASRLRASRTIVVQCLPHLTAAYNKEESKLAYEEMFDTMLAALSWLTALHDAVQAVLKGGEPRSIGPEVRVEYEESKATLKSLKQTIESLTGWESETIALSIDGPTDSRVLVEVGDSELEEEDDFGSSDLDDLTSER